MRLKHGFLVGLGLVGLSGCVIVPAGPPGHARRGGPVIMAPASIMISARPRMVFVTEFGVSFAPELDVELYEVGGVWYSFYSGGWYRADAYDGPWVVVKHRHLPRGLAKVKPGQVRKFYSEHGDNGKGNHEKRGRGKGKKDD